VDIDARSDADVELTRSLPFDDASVHAIFCEEVIEHLELSASNGSVF
jgi:predicted SAM-dependent methyltransferase